MNKKILASALFAASITSNTLMAEGAPGSGPNPFSDCGIGAAIFSNNVAASISNVIWDIGTTAVTSATASPETCNGKDAVVAEFIFESYDNLMEETANGSGQHISSLMNILELNEEVHADVISTIRMDMTSALSESTYSTLSSIEKAEIFYHSIMKAAEKSA